MKSFFRLVVKVALTLGCFRVDDDEDDLSQHEYNEYNEYGAESIVLPSEIHTAREKKRDSKRASFYKIINGKLQKRYASLSRRKNKKSGLVEDVYEYETPEWAIEKANDNDLGPRHALIKSIKPLTRSQSESRASEFYEFVSAMNGESETSSSLSKQNHLFRQNTWSSTFSPLTSHSLDENSEEEIRSNTRNTNTILENSIKKCQPDNSSKPYSLSQEQTTKHLEQLYVDMFEMIITSIGVDVANPFHALGLATGDGEAIENPFRVDENGKTIVHPKILADKSYRKMLNRIIPVVLREFSKISRKNRVEKVLGLENHTLRETIFANNSSDMMDKVGNKIQAMIEELME